jgi:phage baseplate assembly protein W
MNHPPAAQVSDTQFLGTGWAFPITFDLHPLKPKDGRPEPQARMREGEDDIKQSIRLIFGIAPGERQMLPAFGCDLSQFIFGPVDLSVRTMIGTVVKRALLDYEPRINVLDVRVVLENSAARSALLIEVEYVVRTTNRRYNLVYPYFLSDGSGVVGAPQLPGAV